jgi:hypothetical protein
MAAIYMRKTDGLLRCSSRSEFLVKVDQLKTDKECSDKFLTYLHGDCNRGSCHPPPLMMVTL